MRLDLSALRYMTNEDFRVLTAIEMGMRNHEIVPVELIESIAKLKRANTSKIIANLLKHKLVEHTNLKYDGYSLNFLGYDFLSIHTMMKRGILVKMGPKLGVGKESDVFICYVDPKAAEKYKENKDSKEITDEEYNRIKEKVFETKQMEKENEEEENEDEENENENENEEDEDKDEVNEKTEKNENQEETEEDDFVDPMINKFEEELNILDIQCHIAIIKIARLGRTSFRAVKNKRDYVKNKTHYNWLYLSRVSAINEFKFLSGLYNNGFSVPKPYDHNRHCILMQYIPSYPLCKIEDLGNKEKAYNDLIAIICSLANKGLIHGDFNEFNILIEVKSQKIFFIDFPQMISLAHQEAETYFLRDIQCINKFFKKKFGMSFDNSQVDFHDVVKHRDDYLDIKYKAYGYESALHSIDDKHKSIMINNKSFDDELDEENFENKAKNNKDELDLNFDEEIKNDKELGKLHSEKIEVNSYTIKMKVKKLLLKENSKQGRKSNNRFKEGKKEKIEI